MSYIRLDDRFPSHPKIGGLSDPAFRLWVSGIAYCGSYLTDGLVPASAIPLLVHKSKARAAVRELVDRLLWVELDGGLAYEVHDYLEWNDSREVVEKRKAQARAAARRRWET